jgi:Flp pilus assembly protein CpaB
VKRSNRLVILVGVLLAVLAFVAIVILLNQPTEPSGQDGEEPTTVTVSVANEDIEIGEEVTPEKVRPEEVREDAVLGQAMLPSEFRGEPALFPVPADAQVSGETVGRGGPETVVDIDALLNPGEKAIAFQVDRVTGLDFLVTAGDNIDVILSQQISVLQETADSVANTDPDAPPRFEAVTGLEDQRTVKAVLQNKRVLYVSQTRAVEQTPVEDTNGDGVVDENDAPPEAVIDSVIIVFAGSDQDAEVIKFAQNSLGEQGALTAVVRHLDDDEPEDTSGITIDQLVEDYGLRIPGIIEQLNEEQPAP